ncbi:MAG: xylulokinase [Anaerolineae bacterium]|nr:xylulokinase [Anaerolineae bacterium]
MLIGMDLGTSSVRVAVVDQGGRILGLGQREYSIEVPCPGWAEQDTEVWWRATAAACSEALHCSQVPPASVRAIGLSGQMHGTVLVSDDGRAIGRAIIWADGRSAAVADGLNCELGLDRLACMAGNRVSPGFMAATLRWLGTERPELLEKARWALLPKDYLRLRLTGEAASEPSDASASLLFDITRDQWSAELTSAAGVETTLLPGIVASHAVAGRLTAAAAEVLGLQAGTPVVAGAGDQAAQAVGNGVLEPSTASCTVGTGGQLLQPAASPSPDPQLRVHCFRHAVPGTWFLMAAILSAGLSLRWWRDTLGLPADTGYQILDGEAAEAGLGAGGLLFLPYLLGERTPHMDSRARGAFVGLALGHGRGHLARAIMEGVAMALAEGLEVLSELVPRPSMLVASGGGARSRLWRQIQADVLGLPLTTVIGQERAVVGAAMLAGMGAGVFHSFEEARQACVMYGPSTEPQPQARREYERLAAMYRSLYPALRQVFEGLADWRVGMGAGT